ncbi:MAG: pectinesterase family protein [Verrucomicrobiota bacterium]
MKTIVSLLAVLIISASALTAQTNSPAGKIKIVLVGDSTVTDNAGWGLGFKQFLTADVECLNTSRGGRSSQSFMTEGRWTNALALKGDYYLIQFGHNNEPGKPGRSTDMPTFVANMKQYVDDARAIGAKPILVTPLTRRQWDKANPGKIKSSLAPYAEEVRKIASEKKVPLVDLQARSIELCESLGPEKCLEFSPPKVVDGTNTGGFDGTHLNAKGYVLFAQLVVEELRKSAPELALVLRSEPANANPVAKEAKFHAVVAFDGSGSHTNVQEAVNAAPDNGTNWFIILVKPDVYEGQVIIPKTKRFIHIVGEDRATTVLTWPYNVNDRKPNQPYQFDPGFVVVGNDFRAENLTFENSSGDHGQALAVRVDNDRAVFENCRLLGWQDTLMVNNGRHYFTNCFIAGRVDFIYGSATAVFDRCEIQSKNGGYITAASTPKEKEFGLVFLNCKLTGDPKPWNPPVGQTQFEKSDVKAYLGRPWRSSASVAFLNCEIGAHIRPEGWHNWGNPTNEITARYAEYNSTGAGANPAARVKWAKQLTDAEAKDYTVERILKGKDGWSPQREK